MVWLEVQDEEPDKPTIQHMVLEYDGLLGWLRGLPLGVEVEYGESHLPGYLVGVYPYSCGGEANHPVFVWWNKSCGDRLVKDNQVKLKNLIVAMAMITSGKLTYATQLWLFDEGDDSKNIDVVEAFLTYWLSWYVLPSGLEDSRCITI